MSLNLIFTAISWASSQTRHFGLKHSSPQREDGLFVVKLLMACYMSAEEGKKLKFPPEGLEEFIPKVAKGIWNPRNNIKVVSK